MSLNPTPSRKCADHRFPFGLARPDNGNYP